MMALEILTLLGILIWKCIVIWLSGYMLIIQIEMVYVHVRVYMGKWVWRRHSRGENVINGPASTKPLSYSERWAHYKSESRKHKN